MSRTFFVTLILVTALVCAAAVQAQPPQAPATISWLPHGYGGTMFVPNTVWSNMKGLHGFRTSPMHIGCWSQPLWGWDVNGFYLGPQVPSPDPVDCQLPIGLIYPENSAVFAPPPPPRRVSGR